MTTEEKTKKIYGLAESVSDSLHASHLTHAEVLDVIAVVLCAEVVMAHKECGDAGSEAVFTRFLRACSRMVPGVTFNMMRRMK